MSMHAFDTLVLYGIQLLRACLNLQVRTGGEGCPGILTKIQGFRSTCPGICPL